MIKNYFAMLLCLGYVGFSIWRIKNNAMTKKGWFLMICFALFFVFMIIMTIQGVPLDEISKS